MPRDTLLNKAFYNISIMKWWMVLLPIYSRNVVIHFGGTYNQNTVTFVIALDHTFYWFTIYHYFSFSSTCFKEFSKLLVHTVTALFFKLVKQRIVSFPWVAWFERENTDFMSFNCDCWKKHVYCSAPPAFERGAEFWREKQYKKRHCFWV